MGMILKQYPTDKDFSEVWDWSNFDIFLSSVMKGFCLNSKTSKKDRIEYQQKLIAKRIQFQSECEGKNDVTQIQLRLYVSAVADHNGAFAFFGNKKGEGEIGVTVDNRQIRQSDSEFNLYNGEGFA